MKGFRQRKLDRIHKERNHREWLIHLKLVEIAKLQKEVDVLREKQTQQNISTVASLHLAVEEETCNV